MNATLLVRTKTRAMGTLNYCTVLSGFFNEIVVLARISLSPVQPGTRLVYSGSPGLLIPTEGYPDALEKDVHPLAHLVGRIGDSQDPGLTFEDDQPLRQEVYQVDVVVHHQH